MRRDEIRKRYEYKSLTLLLPGYVARAVSEEQARNLAAEGVERTAARMSDIQPNANRNDHGQG